MATSDYRRIQYIRLLQDTSAYRRMTSDYRRMTSDYRRMTSNYRRMTKSSYGNLDYRRMDQTTVEWDLFTVGWRSDYRRMTSHPTVINITEEWLLILGQVSLRYLKIGHDLTDLNFVLCVSHKKETLQKSPKYHSFTTKTIFGLNCVTCLDLFLWFCGNVVKLPQPQR